MRLNQIQLENFRNYGKLEITFDPDKNVNLFIGDNAQGKTNFLEAITLLSLAKSFRNVKHGSLIKWDEDFTRIVGKATNNNDFVLEYFASIAPANKKNLRKDGADVSIKGFIGQLNIVLFHPEDLNMLYLSPSLRRKYMNIILSQTDPLYFDALVQYNRIVKQRNKMLFLIDQGKSSPEELDAWDEQLAQYGTYILQKRLGLTDFFNKRVEGNYNDVSQTKDTLKVKYVSSMPESALTKEEYFNALKSQQSTDLRYAQTTKGIHRDDIMFDFNGHNISEFGSRGEMRTLLIALKFTEIEYIEQQTERKPILLLDDVFSELDKKRQQFLMNAIQEFQSFITTTHHDFSIEGASIFEIEKGNWK